MERARSPSEKFVPTHIWKGQLELLYRIGKGTFGSVYRAVDKKTGREWAVKLESFHIDGLQKQLEYESRIYRAVRNKGKFPIMEHCGWEGNYRFIVMDLLGPSLETLFNICDRQFSLKTVLMLGYQMLMRLEEFHKSNFIHSDIKPDNFVIESWNNSTVYIIDFGLAKRYIDIFTHQHIVCQKGKHLSGTARYSSSRAHRGFTQSRRDDLEALCYVLIYFLDGSLPWQGSPETQTSNNYTKIFSIKSKISVQELCKFFPEAFKTFMSYCRNLRFYESPDYKYLRGLIEIMMQDENYIFDGVFDWDLKRRKNQEDKSSSSGSPA